MENKEIDEHGRLVYCAHCGEKNTFKQESATFCIYCGYSLLNICTNHGDCGQVLPPDAAYCPFCGSKSHFLQSNLIKSKRKIELTDDDLPF